MEADGRARLTFDQLMALSEAELGMVASLCGRAQRELDGLRTRVARALRAQEQAGSGPVADDVLRGEGKVSAREAKRQGERARAAELFPVVGKAIDDGEASGENVDSLAEVTKGMSPGELDRMGALDGEIAGRVLDPPEVFGKFVRGLGRNVRDDDGGLSEAEKQKAKSRLKLRRRFDGMWEIDGLFDPERARVLNDLLRRRASKLAGDRPVTANDMAAAFYDLATNGSSDGGGDVGVWSGPRMGIGYIVDAATLFEEPTPGSTSDWQRSDGVWVPDPPPRDQSGRPGHDGPRRSDRSDGPRNDQPKRNRGRRVAETWDGEDVDPGAVQRLACDADLYAILFDRLGMPTSVGRTRRSATREQRIQLRALYDTCPLDGATPFARCEIHHVNVHFEDGGETEIDNLVPVSARWHHVIHDRKWTLKMGPDRELRIWRPDGTLHKVIPPPKPITKQIE